MRIEMRWRPRAQNVADAGQVLNDVERNIQEHNEKMDPFHANYDETYARDFRNHARLKHEENNTRRRNALWYRNSEEERLRALAALQGRSLMSKRMEENIPLVNETDLYEDMAQGAEEAEGEVSSGPFQHLIRSIDLQIATLRNTDRRTCQGEDQDEGLDPDRTTEPRSCAPCKKARRKCSFATGRFPCAFCIARDIEE